MTVTTEDSRLCEQCVQLKPAAEFRRRTRSGSQRLGQCRDCHNRAERERRASKRLASNDRQMGIALTQLKNARSDAQVKSLCSMLFQQSGGVQGLVAEWGDYRTRAMQQGGLAAVRFLLAYIRLLKYCQPAEPDYSQMTNEELDRAGAELFGH